MTDRTDRRAIAAKKIVAVALYAGSVLRVIGNIGKLARRSPI
jgi:hypothetical protein